MRGASTTSMREDGGGSKGQIPLPGLSLRLRAPVIRLCTTPTRRSNILLTSSEEDERGFIAKVADFGFARVLADGDIKTMTHGAVSHTVRGGRGGRGGRAAETDGLATTSGGRRRTASLPIP